MPTVYLGMPLGNEHKSIQIWDGIVEKTERRLARWKAQYLSMGGRHTLINSVLDSLPTYVMSLFPLPPKVLKKLDKLRRDFLWHGCKEIKGYNLVKWEITLKSKDKGGMGIRDLRKQNNSLLMKWLWRYNEEGQALWKGVIRSKRTKFWTDAWNKQIPLKESFPDLFLLCSNPDANINERWTAQGWDLIYRRFLNDWEVERVAKLIELLEKFPGITNAPDSLRWKHSKDGAFMVSRAYKMESPQQHNSKQSLWRKTFAASQDHYSSDFSSHTTGNPPSRIATTAQLSVSTLFSVLKQ
ncbi:hypothetical protein MTR67_044561 [Solanum verrucosum]|uniref:Uncharacterized protein n=1 Tax=Solanum verrucosum TaxID=315347 RepID=A0AAF0UU65_SOLVR|nr:hypothetical protein MTR67_044561 [Solanum verrucosum]